jgi:hypothetical protein
LSTANLVRFLSAPEAKIAPFSPTEAERQRSVRMQVNAVDSAKSRKRLEARVRIELTYKGFADLSLTTWVPRPTSKLATCE